jgi:Mn2+/Fe2+ NRAMP family transporter
MGVHVNRPITTVVAWAAVGLVTAMNAFLIFQQVVGI